MATLTGKLVADTYKALLKLIDNDILTASEKQISDGFGGGSGVFIDQNGFLRASQYKVTGGTSSQFLKGDGSLDSNTYLSLAAANALYLPIGSTTTAIAEGTRLYFTTGRVLATTLTGFVAVTGTVTASDTILSAIEKIWWNIENGGGGGGGGYVPYIGATQDLNLGTYGLISDFVQLNEINTEIPVDAGTMSWNDADGTADLILKGGNVTLQVGQEEVVRVVNKTGDDLLEENYQAVYISGAQGQRLKVDLALAVTDATSAGTIGLVTETILDNEEGFITSAGLVRKIDTTGDLQGETWADGDVLYLSPTVAGNITNVKPIAPEHTVIIGFVVYAHAINGKIYVKVDNGYELNELHNVLITAVADKNTLVYDDVEEVWKNQTIFGTDVEITAVADKDVLVYNDLEGVWKNKSIFGTQGYVPYYDDTLFMNDSTLFTDGTDFAINTTSIISGVPLRVNGTVSMNALWFDTTPIIRDIFGILTISVLSSGSSIKLQNYAGNQMALFKSNGVALIGDNFDNLVDKLQVDGSVLSTAFKTVGGNASQLTLGNGGLLYIADLPFLVNVNGTNNYVIKYSGTNNAIESQIFDNGSGVSINTSTVTERFNVNGYTLATGYKIPSGTSSQFLKANGSVDSNAYYLESNPYSFISLTELSSSATGLSYSNTTGDFSLTAGYVIPTTTSATNWDTAYTNRITFAYAPLSISANDISISQATTSTDGYLSSTDWNTFNNKTSNTGTVTSVSGTGTVSGLTLTGTVTTTGSLTLGGTLSLTSLNVTTALGFTPVTNARTLTINGTTYDLTADRSWTIAAGISTLTTTGTSGPATLVGSTLNVPNYSAGASAVRNVSTFTATSGQTTFTIIGGYTVGLIDVFINGARLSTADYTATNSSTVVLGTGAVLNDIVDVVNYTATFTAGISGTGTANYITKWTGSATVNSSIIYDNGTNVGIGTISPTSLLHIKSTTEPQFKIEYDSTNFTTISHNTLNFRAADFIFQQNTTEVMRFKSGNIGLGMQPYNNGISKAFDLVGGGGMFGFNNNFYLSGNGYFTDSWRYKANGGLSIIELQAAGNIVFSTAGSGTANAAVSPTEKMRVQSNGEVGIATTSTSGWALTLGALGTNGGLNIIVGVPTLIANFSNTSNNPTNVRWSNYNGNFYDIANNPSTNSFTIDYNDNERFRIASSGNILMGITTDNARLTVDSGAASSSQPTVWLNQGVGGGGYALIAGTDSYHSVTFRGAPNNSNNYSTSAEDVMSFVEYGGQFRFYKKQPGLLSQQVRFTDGVIYAVNTSVQSISDIRTKENIVNSNDGLNIITDLRPVRFDFKDGFNESKKNQLGFIAQEIEKIFPDAMGEWKNDNDGITYKTVGPSSLIPVIVKAIQELKSELDQLKTK